MSINVMRTLAEWIAAPDLRVGSSSLEQARHAFVDVIGCAIAGHADAAVLAAVRAARHLGSGNVASLGHRGRYPAPWAAMIGATAAHALDYDDTGATSIAHVSAVMVPALLALGEEENSDMGRVLEAYVAGFETTMRLGGILNPAHYERGWYATATVGLVGTAAACARVLGLDRDATLSAISIATNFAAGSRRQIGSAMKATQAGIAAKNAVLAARLAQAGTQGSEEPMCGEGGWISLMSAMDDEQRLAAAIDGLGQAFALDGFERLQKFFPCCASAHKTLEGMLQLMRRHGVGENDVARTDTWLTRIQRRNLRFDRPVNAVQARFSLPYCAATLLKNHELRLSDFDQAHISDPAMAHRMSRIHLHDDAAAGAAGQGDPAALMTSPLRTTMTLNNGQVLEISVGAPRGCHVNPMSAEDRARKFSDCCEYAGLGIEPSPALQRLEFLIAAQNVPELTGYLSGLMAAPRGVSA